jgi:hypothetical protein
MIHVPVHLHVSVEVASRFEGFSTNLAVLLSNLMGPLVHFQTYFLSALVAAQTAFVWLLTGVYASMILQVVSLSKSLSAVLTPVGFRTRVSPCVV